MVTSHLHHDLIKVVQVDIVPTEHRHLYKRLSEAVEKLLEPSEEASLPEVVRGVVLGDTLGACVYMKQITVHCK